MSAAPKLRTRLVAAACLLGSSLAGPARAHAPPLGSDVLFDANGDLSILVTNRGLIFPEHDVARLLCNEALGINSAEVANVALVSEAMVVATSAGLRRSIDQGCTWQPAAGLGTTSTPALAVDPSTPGTIYVASFGIGQSGIRRTRDGGETWTLLHPLQDEDYVASLLVSEADPARIYASAARYGMTGGPEHFLLRSSDAGQSWQRVPLPLLQSDYLALLLATHPRDEDTLLLGTRALNPQLDDSRLLVSRNAGDAFSVALETPEITSARYEADADRVWVAALDGLFRADAELLEFQSVSVASRLGCTREHEGALWVCGHYAGIGTGHSGVGVSTDGGQTFSARLDFGQVSAQVACAPDSETATRCAQPWFDWQAEMMPAATPVASASSAGAMNADAPAPTAPAASAPATPAAPASGPGREPPPISAACTVRRGPLQLCWLVWQGAACCALFMRRRNHQRL